LRYRRGWTLAATVPVAVPMRRSRQDKAGAEENAALAALADGSIAPERRAALEARVAASSELAGRLAEQQRAVALTRSAAAEVEAPAGLRAGLDAERAAHRCGSDRRSGNRHRTGRLRFGHLWPALRGGPRTYRPCAGCPGRSDAHQDILGLADRALRDGTSPPGPWTLLRGLATERRRPARSDRNVQRGPEGHAVGRRDSVELHDAHRHPRTGRRRSGLVGPEGASRHRSHQLILSRLRAGARPAGARGRAGSSLSPRGSAGRVQPRCTRGR
jgi:hypothetical protein